MEIATDPAALFRRYQELQAYVGWTPEDAKRVQSVGPLLEPSFPALIDDFYQEIQQHPDALKVITGGKAQIERLKGTLLTWVRELFSGNYDSAYVLRRWRVGRKHVEIGLDQVYTNVALSRLRAGLLRALHERWQGSVNELEAVVRSLNALLDLDLAKIEDAYQAEYVARHQRAERLAAIGQVAGGIAHELRNPLNVVKTSVYFLLNARSPSPEKKTEHLQRIERQVLLADGVITALSNFARLPIPNLNATSVRKCVEEALEANPLPADCVVSIEIPPQSPKVLADLDQVRIVFGNLMRNAREAMPKGGSLTITAQAVGDAVEVSVTDTGSGIPPEHLSRIMEPLYSTKARGMGLGLAIARAILDKNKGSLRVASQPGQGSTFTVRLAAVMENEGTST
ncbi:MAG TPA: protoglobin domain-containing protein [Gemmataceae bacterium]|nr:protoglobin domain-containing protein [Gemmataceae bacterium]